MRVVIISLTLICISFSILNAQPAFPGAEGFGAKASGGRGGKVVYVTNLNPEGPGSLAAALDDPEPRYILFKVSGVIPTTVEVPPGRGNFTLAGQTSPGGIITRGFQSYSEEGPSSGNFIVRHLRSRVGDTDLYPTSNWLGADGITLGGVHNAIIDHCSFAHASDEEVDISRSSSLTIQYCTLSETLGDHAYLGGMLINYSSNNNRLDSLSIHHNIWNRIGGRMPEISCETQDCNNRHIKIELSNNLFWDQHIETWYEGVTGNSNGHFYLDINAINNYSVGRSTYSNGTFHNSLLDFTQNNLYFSGNKLNLYPQYSDYELFYCCNDFNLYNPNTELGVANRKSTPFNYPAITYTGTTELISHLREKAGAFPRDSMDRRLSKPLYSGIISNVPVTEAAANDPFILGTPGEVPEDSDEDGMPDYWENTHGLSNNSQDHNDTDLSEEITGVAGYTNLECYLNCLSDYLVNGFTTPECGINSIITSLKDLKEVSDFIVSPNPASDVLNIKSLNGSLIKEIIIMDMAGLNYQVGKHSVNQLSVSTRELSNGIYLLKIKDDQSKTMIKKIVIHH